MPIKTPHTKAQKANVVHTEMHKFKQGELHSGSKSGPIVDNRKQAIAIALSESGQSNKPAAHNFPQHKGQVSTHGHGVDKRRGHERVSGHAGAHRIGRK